MKIPCELWWWYSQRRVVCVCFSLSLSGEKRKLMCVSDAYVHLLSHAY